MKEIREILDSGESFFASGTSNQDSKARDKILYKCKEALEKMQFELEEERKLSQNFKDKYEDAIQKLSEKDNELLETFKQWELVQDQHQKDIDKSKSIEIENSRLRDSTNQYQNIEYQFNLIKEKYAQQISINSKFKNQLMKQGES